MGKPGWTPSIVPNDHDQTIYLVMDKFKSGAVWHQTDAERSDLEGVIMGILRDSIKTRCESLVSTRQRSGQRTFRPTLRTNFAGAVICSFATCPFTWKNSWNATRAVTTRFN
jgi:hypothetical protein